MAGRTQAAGPLGDTSSQAYRISCFWQGRDHRGKFASLEAAQAEHRLLTKA
ncbi:MAG: hypothetical protein QOC89_5367 [Paraburkholderia sp.]|nr:hypothetical protein [Paraburkholderia sp.]